MTMHPEKLLPHDIEAEEAVIGAILIDGQCFPELLTLISHLDFYRERNAAIFAAAGTLFGRMQAIDQITLAGELARTERLESVGGMAYLSQLVAITPTSVHAPDYAANVARTAGMRRLIAAAAQISSIGYDDEIDLPEAIRKSHAALMAVAGELGDDGIVSGREMADRYLQSQADMVDGHRRPPVMSGIQSLDYMTGGLTGGNLMVIGGRPGHGKSALAMNMMRQALDNGIRVGYLSLENTDQETLVRILAHDTGINITRIRQSLFTYSEEERITQALGVISDVPVRIGYRRVHTLPDVRARAVQCEQQMHGLDLLLIDYLQLMRGPSARSNGNYNNRVQELADITGGIKRLALEMDVPIVLCSQLNRQIESRTDHSPNLADLRDSGSIEQDADIVLFVVRHALFGDDAKVDYPDGLNPAEAAELIIAKNRNANPGSAWCRFDGATMRFSAYTG